MRKILLFVFLAVAAMQNAEALVIGRNGDPVVVDGVTWQPIHLTDTDVGFHALIPGTPRNGIAEGKVFSKSDYRGVYYEISTHFSSRYQPPETEAQFLKQIRAVYGREAKVTGLATMQSKVKYVASVQFYSNKKVGQIFCSHNQLYTAFVEGTDLSLSKHFFESIKVTR